MANGGEISICPEIKTEMNISINIICKGEVIDKTSIFKDSSSSEELLSLQ